MRLATSIFLIILFHYAEKLIIVRKNYKTENVSGPPIVLSNMMPKSQQYGLFGLILHTPIATFNPVEPRGWVVATPYGFPRSF